MTEKMDYKATISTSGLSKVGIDEDRARKLYSRRGREVMGIIRLAVDETTDKADHTHRVGLSLSRIEIVLDHADMENHLRDLETTLYSVRQQEDGQLAIDQQLGGGERTTADVMLARGRKFSPHPFIVVDASVENPICDVCGSIEASAVHSTQDILDDPETDGSDPSYDEVDSEGNPVDPEDEDVDRAEDEEGWEEDPDVVDARNRHLATVPDPFAAPA